MGEKELEQEALKEAAKSLCKKRKVGAIIVDIDGNILSRGHNYNIAPGEVECESPNGETLNSIIHAEVAAIDVLSPALEDLANTIFVTHFPCENCQKEINKLGLQVKVVTEFMKFDKGKLRYSLIPPEAMRALAEVLTYGAKKYKPNNWQQVNDTSRYVDALYRHLEAWRSDEKVDEESGLPHLAHALTNIAFLIYFETDKSQN